MTSELTNEEKLKILTKVVERGGLDRYDKYKSFMYFICYQFALTPDFIREYRDLVNWKVISTEQQIIDTDFLREFEKYLDWDYIGKRGRFVITSEQRKEFKKYFET